MKRVIQTALIVILHASTGFSLCAMPSDRPLPKRLADESQDFEILRDHQVANQFYVLPKTISVNAIEVGPFGKQEFGCQAVDKYLENLKLLVESRTRLAQLNLDRLEILSELLKSQKNTLRAKTDVRNQIQLINEQISIEQQSMTPNQQRLEELRKERVALEGQSASFDEDLEHYQRMQLVLDQEQEKILEQTQENEASGEEFAKQVARAAAQVSTELRIESLSRSDAQFRSELGFRDSDIIKIPQIIGLDLRPDENSIQDMNFLERHAARKEIGLFSPVWSEEAIEFKPSAFEDATEIPNDGILRRLPSVFRFGQILSLLQYCRVSESPSASSLMLGISYRVPLWVDADEPDFQLSELIYHSFSLDQNLWEKLQGLPTIEFNVVELQAEDPGDPTLYSQKGRIISRTIELEIIEQTEE